MDQFGVIVGAGIVAEKVYSGDEGSVAGPELKLLGALAAEEDSGEG